MADYLSSGTEPFSTDPSASGEGDFSQLPYVVWVQVLKYLNSTDRQSVSLTCHYLSQVFRDPCLWRRLHIKLVPCDSSSHPDEGVVRFYGGFLRNFAKYIKEIELLVHKQYVMSTDSTVLKLLHSLHPLCDEHQLNKLHIDVGGQLNVVRRNTRTAVDATAEIELLGSLMEACLKSGTLRELYVENWPLMPDGNEFQRVYTPLFNNSYPFLFELSLFWCNAEHSTWLGKNMIPTPAEFTTIIKNLPKVTVLRVQSCMLSDEALEYLCSTSRDKIRLLAVLVPKPANINNIPAVSRKALMAFVKHHYPLLDMHITLATRLHIDITSFWFAAGLPVTEIHYMKFAEFRNEHAALISANHAHLLHKLCVYSSSEYHVDSKLLQLVQQCTNLRHFVFYGHIQVNTVETLADIHTNSWKTFDIWTKNVVTETDFEGNEDEVIRRRCDGTILMVDFERSFEQSPRSMKLDSMVIQVCINLGRLWRPRDFRLEQVQPVNV